MWYTYTCEGCQHTFEVAMTLQEKEAGAVPQCPQCQHGRVRQVFFPPLVLTSGRSGGGETGEFGDTDVSGGAGDEASMEGMGGEDIPSGGAGEGFEE